MVQKHATALADNMEGFEKAYLEDVHKRAGPLAAREFEFDEGPFGFSMDGATISYIEPGGQAEALGLRVGDGLLEVAGQEVPPPPPPGDVEAEKQARQTLKKWLKDLPRPGTLTFGVPEPDAPAQPAGAASAHEAGAGALSLADVERQARAAEASAAAESRRAEGLGAELQIVLEQNRQLESELEQLRAWGGEASGSRHHAVESDESVGTAQERSQVQLKALQEQLLRSRSESEAARRKVGELQGQLAAADRRCQELSQASLQSEEYASEALNEREGVLNMEVQRLRGALGAQQADSLAAAKAAEQRSTRLEEDASDLRREAARRARELVACEDRAVAAEGQVAALTRQAASLRDEHAAEVSRLRAQHTEAVLAMQQQQEQELERVCREVAEAREQQAESEAAEERPQGRGSFLDCESSEDLPASSEALGGSDSALQERVSFLEQRCATLQSKLNSSPIVPHLAPLQ